MTRHQVIRTVRDIRLRAALVVCLILGFVSAGFGQKNGDYIVGPNDVLAVMVVEQPQLTGKYIVRADGTFTFPLVGRVMAGGRSLSAVEDEIGERLAKGFLKNPQIGVSVDQYRSQQIFVIGEVRQPGALQFTGIMSFVEALARAGSVTERAGIGAVIVRPNYGAPAPDVSAITEAAAAKVAGAEDVKNVKDASVIRVSLEFLKTGQLPENISLRGGDTIFVPKAATAFVSGQVRSPGEYPIGKDMTVREVLALAGGVVERGSTRRIQVIRQVNGTKITKDISLNDLVQAGDNVIVRDRLF
jgi:polysaccharide biosynthesis/export protein